MTLVLSDQCNFSCPYCPQQKGKNTLKIGDIRSFLDLLRPRLAGEVWLGFYGGEPLLSWPLIKKTVAYANAKFESKFHFTLTSNGSLLKMAHISFMKEHRFALLLSYDGLAQKNRDAASVAAVEAALEDLRRHYPGGYIVNSVFTPRTVPLLAASMEALLRRGHARLQYALDLSAPWKKEDLAVLERQLDRLATIAMKHWRKTGKIQLENFKDPDRKGVFSCSAGRDRLALLPDRTVWGCYLFYDLLGHDPANPDYARYCFGELKEFIALPARALAARAASYAELRQDYFFSEKKKLCSLCDDLEHCAVCPAVAALATRIPGVIPGWTCRLKQIGRRAQGRLAAATAPPAPVTGLPTPEITAP